MISRFLKNDLLQLRAVAKLKHLIWWSGEMLSSELGHYSVFTVSLQLGQNNAAGLLTNNRKRDHLSWVTFLNSLTSNTLRGPSDEPTNWLKHILALQTKWSTQAIKNLTSNNKDGLAKHCRCFQNVKAITKLWKTRMDAFIGKETPAHKHGAKKISRTTYWSGTQEMSPNKTKSLAQGQRKTESTVLLPVPLSTDFLRQSFTYSLSQKWVHPSHLCKYFIIPFHVTLKKWHFATI